MITQLTPRQERGQAIAQYNGQVQYIDEMLYTVQSQSGNGEYTINKINGEWFCTCPDNTYRHTTCKHIYAIEFSQQIKQTVKANTIIQELVQIEDCQFCHSKHIKKMGIRHNKSGDIQRYLPNASQRAGISWEKSLPR